MLGTCWTDFLVLEVLLVDSLCFLYRQLYHLLIRTVLFLPFWSVLLVFSFLHLLHWLEIPALCWIRVLKTYLRRKEKTFTLSPSNMMLAIVLLFFFCRCFSSSWNLYFYFLFFRDFIMNRHWILLNGFSASIDKILWFFFL